MKINRPSICECALLGGRFADQLKLGLFGFLAPLFNTSRHCWGRPISRLVPNRMWIKPRNLNGFQLLVDPTDWSQTVIFREVFLESNYDLDRVKFAPTVIIDCGAHIGMFSLLARSRYQSAELIAYEPNPRNAEIIRLLIAKNRLALSFNECAVSTESAELSFVAINSHGGRLAGKESAHLKMGDSPVYKVQVVDFPAALRAMYIESLLLKMDIEGEERNVLPAIMPLLPRRTALFFETHHGKVGWSEIEGLLTRNGFTVEQINARGLYCDGFASRLS